jgi:hypothetical protein
VAFNLDAGTLEFFKNNVSQGVAFTGLSGTFSPAIGDAVASSASFNFGQRPFAYAAPSGFKALRDYNRQLVPTGGVIRGNYATMNDINPVKATYVNGALQITGGDRGGVNTFGMTSGKWFCEMDIVAIGSESSLGVSKGNLTMVSYVGGNAESWGYYSTGTKYTNGASVGNYGTSFTTGDTIGCAFDADLGLLSFYKNGIPYGVAFSGLTSGPYFFASSGRSSTSANNVYLNFGQRPWVYGPPAGFKPVCVTSIPQPTIQKSSTAMDVVTYTGTGANQSVSGLDFSPDLVWVKGRSGATDHALYDVIRGSQARLESNTTDAEVTADSGLTSFDSNGFTLGTLAQANTNAATYVGWAWDAGSSNSSNTSGTISSTVRTDPTKGFSIVSYTGNGTNNATVGHGLGVSPRFVIVKNRTTASTDWPVYHVSLAANNIIFLHLTGASGALTSFNFGGVSAVSSTTITLTNGSTDGRNVNKSGDNHIAYCFSEVDGYSKFGTFTGNGAADGSFVWCGFLPKFIIAKRDAAAKPWFIYDSSRSTTNVNSAELRPNTNEAENGGSLPGQIDMLSNGFKIRSDSSKFIGESGTFLFAAFAESPFKYARAR